MIPFGAVSYTHLDVYKRQPCGACRQVMVEFKIPLIIMGNLMGDIKIVSMEELLPFSFSESDVIGK